MALNRIIQITMGPTAGLGITVTDLKMEIEIFKTDKESKNKAKARIFNISESNATTMAKEGNKIIIKAGYEDESVNSLFFGDIQTSLFSKQGSDRVLEVEAYDGQSNATDKNASISYAGGISAQVILDQLILLLGYPLAKPVTPLQASYANGYAFIGKVTDALTEVLSYGGKVWSIQNEQLVITGPNEVIERTGFLLSPQTGLLSKPELLVDKDESQNTLLVPKRYKVKSLLYPQLVPRSEFQLQSENVNGFFRIETADYRGNNRFGEFIVNLEVVSI